MSKAVVTDERPTLREANIARQKEWDAGNQITLTYRGNELAGEVGEACNIMKKLERERLGIRGSRATVEQLAEELADIVICTDLVAMSEGIDMDAAVAAKFNATSEKVGLATRLVPLSHGAEAVEPEHKPVGARYEAVKAALVAKNLHSTCSAQEAVKVKPLEWREDWFGSDDDIVGWVADTPWGRLSASVAGFRDAYGKAYERHADVPHELRAKLQSAAQAGYERRVRSALLPPGGETATPDTPPPESHVTGPEGRQGDWMQTVTGRQFWPIDPRPEDIHIEDIAHALSMMCRFGGHCDRFYSVAEHSVLVSENVPPQDALWALLHDASEAYIADIVRPAKRFINGYRDIEGRIMAAVCGAFDLPYIEPPSVKRADNAILADEAAQIMGTKPKDWILPEPPLGVLIIGLSPADAKAAFLTRYRALTTATTEGSAE